MDMYALIYVLRFAWPGLAAICERKEYSLVNNPGLISRASSWPLDRLANLILRLLPT